MKREKTPTNYGTVTFFMPSVNSYQEGDYLVHEFPGRPDLKRRVKNEENNVIFDHKK